MFGVGHSFAALKYLLINTHVEFLSMLFSHFSCCFWLGNFILSIHRLRKKSKKQKRLDFSSGAIFDWVSKSKRFYLGFALIALLYIQTNHTTFTRFRRLGCFYFEYSLALQGIFPSSDCRCNTFGFGFMTLNREALQSHELRWGKVINFMGISTNQQKFTDKQKNKMRLLSAAE